MSNDIPKSWHPHFERKGIPVSYRGLAAKADMSHEAVRRVIRGWSVKDSTIRQIADALGVDVEVVYELRGESPDRPVAWEPPASSSLLSHEEREAFSRLISLITSDRQESGPRGNTAPTKTAGHDPAPLIETQAMTPKEPPRAASPRNGSAPRRQDRP